MTAPRTAFPAPSAVPTIGFGPADGRIPVHLCLNLPAGRPMVDLAAAITALTEALGGHWQYRYMPNGQGEFYIHAQEIAP